MVENWYREKYGWDTNPFNIQASQDHHGYKDLKAKCFRHIDSNNFFMIYGVPGSGKTSLLSWLQDQEDKISDGVEFKYFDAPNMKVEDLKQFISDGKGFLPDIFNIRNKTCNKKVALIDNAQDLPHKVCKELERAHYQEELHAVGLASLDKKPDITDSLLDRIKNKQFKVRDMEIGEAKAMLRNRLQGKESPFTEEAIEAVIEASNYSPRQILDNCHHLAMNCDHPIGADQVIEKLEQKELAEASRNLARSELLDRVTETQADILTAVKEIDEGSTEEIYEQGAGGSSNAVRAQLSRLSSEDYLDKKDIPFDIVESERIENEDKTVWRLTEQAEKVLAED